MFKWVKQLFQPAADAYGARQERKKEEMVAKLNADAEKLKANAELVRQGRAADADWELAAWKHSGWKDEFWSLTFGVVFIGSFVPVVQDSVQRGIDQITGYPLWFQMLFAAIVLASHGIRYRRRKGF